ncbi:MULTISPECIES: hypothetical protein [Streptomyces]|uniref:hypothetical protein n=1 Tax=Streptomyces TaxID=1883 RepID=UPI0021D1CD93|nr:hypothetical protein [Streptomyces sp. G-5]MCU4747916.1 hypothetical protein [Streptomyces sp. G-5]
MIKEQALLESRTLRENVRGRTETLDKVKALTLLPDGLHVTTALVATYFVVHRSTIKNLVARHRQELTESGLTVLQGADLQKFVGLKMSPTDESYPQGNRRHLTLYTRRTVLNIAMLLRDSPVAREVRAYLLDAVEGNGTPASDLEPRVAALEGLMADIGPALRDLGMVLHRRDQRVVHSLRRVDNRLEKTEWIVAGMSARLAELAGDPVIANRLRRRRRGRP